MYTGRCLIVLISCKIYFKEIIAGSLSIIFQREFVNKCLTGFSTGINTISTIGTLDQSPAIYAYAFGVQIQGTGLLAGEWFLV